MRRAFLQFVLVVYASLCGAAALAQQTGRIVAVVNDDIITRYDVIARLGIALSSSDVEDRPEIRSRLGPQILRTLVDERLQVQEARRLGIGVSASEIAREIATIEQRNNMDPGGLARYLGANGLDIRALEEHLLAEVAWRKVLNRRIVPRIEVGADEVVSRLAERRAAVGSREYAVSEIFLALDGPAQEDEVRAAADGIVAQLRAGASFSGLARQFSQSSSAATGGDIGRVRSGQLDPRLEAALEALAPGGFSVPVRLDNGFYILLLRESGIVKGAPEVELALKRLYFAAPEGTGEEGLAALRERAAAAASTVAGCADMERAAAEAGLDGPVDAGRLALEDMPERLQDAVAKLDTEVASDPVRWEDGFLVLMVCDRSESPAFAAERAEIAQQLRLERINRRADRYLQDLRREALTFRRG